MDNKKSIEKIPKIRQEIIDAINQNKLVLFIGAGVSALTGLPLWNSLAKEFIDICEKDADYRYAFRKICYKECPKGSRNSTLNQFYCDASCSEAFWSR